MSRYGKMAVHTVGVCRFGETTPLTEFIVPQDGMAVKYKFSQNDNRSGRIKCVTHDSGESRKKGSDVPYGNGQRRIVRQDHA